MERSSFGKQENFVCLNRIEMTDAFVQTVIIPNSTPISNLYQAVKMGQQKIGTGYPFCYRYTSIQGLGSKNYCGRALVDYLYYSSYLNTLSQANLTAFIASAPTTVDINGTSYLLESIDMEVLILFMQMSAVANLYSATKYAQQYRAENKCYCYTAPRFVNLSGTYLPQITYGQNQLYTWALQCL